MSKDQKHGRHSRAPSNKQQSIRSARNKRLNIEANPWSVKNDVRCAGHAQPKRRDACMNSSFRLEETHRMRIDAQRAAANMVALHGTGLSFSEKLLTTTRPHVNLHDWKLARAAQRKHEASNAKRMGFQHNRAHA